jgi:pimeloyl-ACP methyl ester carboxylesterase
LLTGRQTTLLDVSGARLYCEAIGEGPTLLLIPPGLGDCGFYSRLAELLAGSYRVVTYDRRGNSRSRLDDLEADLDAAVQADDARRVAEALGEGPAFVFGGSGGAIVGLELAARAPAWIRCLIAHEPPVVALLPDAVERQAFFDDVYQVYVREGVRPAMQKFTWAYQEPGRSFDFDPEYLPDADTQTRLTANAPYFLSHEMRRFAQYAPDVDALRRLGSRLVLAAGAESTDRYPARCAAALRDRLGGEFAVFPGGHVGYMERPKQFAETLRRVLDRGGRGSA